jgi:hypothetical protein
LNFRMFAIYLVDRLYNAQGVIASQKRESVANRKISYRTPDRLLNYGANSTVIVNLNFRDYCELMTAGKALRPIR